MATFLSVSTFLDICSIVVPNNDAPAMMADTISAIILLKLESNVKRDAEVHTGNISMYKKTQYII